MIGVRGAAAMFEAAPLYADWCDGEAGGPARQAVEAAAAQAEERKHVAAAARQGSGMVGGKPADRLAAALGIEFKAAREMIRKARAGDVALCLEIHEAIGFEVQVDEPKATEQVAAEAADGEDGGDDFEFM